MGPQGRGRYAKYVPYAFTEQGVAMLSSVLRSKQAVRVNVEIKVGDSKVMLADESQAMNFLAPPARGGTPVHMHLYVKNVDATVAKAIEAGAKMMREVQDMFYGDRTASIEDPFGHFWHVATHIRDVTMKEMKRAAEEMAKAAGG